jgi:hypothetical protein
METVSRNSLFRDMFQLSAYDGVSIDSSELRTEMAGM